MDKVLKIRKEYLDSYVNSPLNGKDVCMRFLPEDHYPFFYKRVPHIFQFVKAKINKENNNESDAISE